MQTASFYHSGLDWSDPRLVSIARWAPRTWEGRRYTRLAPTVPLLKHWQASAQDDEERELFRNAYLYGLGVVDPRQVPYDLGSDAILLCWEKPGEFCHRRLVAEWLERELGIEVAEYVPTAQPASKC